MLEFQLRRTPSLGSRLQAMRDRVHPEPPSLWFPTSMAARRHGTSEKRCDRLPRRRRRSCSCSAETWGRTSLVAVVVAAVGPQLTSGVRLQDEEWNSANSTTNYPSVQHVTLTTSTLEVTPALDFPRLLIVMRSSPKRYVSHLLPNLNTWMSMLGEHDKVITIMAAEGKTTNWSSFPRELGVIPVACKDGHDLVCVASEYHQIAFELMHGFDAMYVIDDDVYLQVANLKEVMKRSLLDTQAAALTGFGLFGCGLPCCDEHNPATVKGFCGGGGFGLTQRAALSLMKDGGLTFANRFLKLALEMVQSRQTILSEPLPREDVLVGAMWMIGGVNITDPGGLYGWPMALSDIYEALQKTSPLPVLFHYVDAHAKSSIHAVVTGKTTATPRALLQAAADQRQEYVWQRDAYIAANGQIERLAAGERLASDERRQQRLAGSRRHRGRPEDHHWHD